MRIRSMTDVAPDLKELLPVTHLAKGEPDEEFLWVYEPPDHEGEHGRVHLVNAETDHPADFPLLEDVAPHVTHPDRREGYAYAIKGGWRITDADHKSIKDDPYLEKLILAALRKGDPPAPLPHIRPHGDPLR